jgi:hypothetical protein
VPLMQLHLYSFDNLSYLLPGAIGQPGIVHAVLQVSVRLPTSRALPQKFFGCNVRKIVFVIRKLS